MPCPTPRLSFYLEVVSQGNRYVLEFVCSTWGVGLCSGLSWYACWSQGSAFQLLLRKYVLSGFVSFLSSKRFVIFKAESLSVLRLLYNSLCNPGLTPNCWFSCLSSWVLGFYVCIIRPGQTRSFDYSYMGRMKDDTSASSGLSLEHTHADSMEPVLSDVGWQLLINWAKMHHSSLYPAILQTSGSRAEVSREGRVDSKSVALIQSFLINTMASYWQCIITEALLQKFILLP